MSPFGWPSVALLLGMSVMIPPGAQPFRDVDGAGDCSRLFVDYGDAPENVLAYPGVTGNFPTCRAPGSVGTQELACASVSTPPGATGWIEHHAENRSYWLGCFAPDAGVDSEPDGKTNQPAVGFSFCSPALATDCVETAPWGMTFDQDECIGDVPGDATLRSPFTMFTCLGQKVPLSIFNCGTTRRIYLNICVDMNSDGDWNDNFTCSDGVCAYEWAVRNFAIDIPAGCLSTASPIFRVGPRRGPAWMRITISDHGVGPDYPWNGSAAVTVNGANGWLWNGETEDYPIALVDPPTPVKSNSWGVVKIRYR